MNISDTVTLYGSLAGVITSVIGGVYCVIKRFATLESKVDLIYAVLMRQSIESTIKFDLGQLNSPLVIKTHARELLCDMLDEIKMEYANIKKSNKAATDADLFMGLSKSVGGKIMHAIAIPNNLPTDALLVSAIAICKEGEV